VLQIATMVMMKIQKRRKTIGEKKKEARAASYVIISNST